MDIDKIVYREDGLFKPRRKILGRELSRVVEEISSEVTKFKPLDEILASTF